MKPTRTIRVLGKLARVFLVPPGHRRLKDGPEDEEPGYGLYEENSLKIYIATGQPLDQEQDTQLHELFHLIDDLLEVGLSEEQVVKLTTGWLATLKENPKLLSYLSKRK